MSRESDLYLRDMVPSVWKLPPAMTPSEWVESTVQIPQRVSSRAGYLTYDREPFWREPLNMMADPTVEDIVIACGTQLGKTTLATAAVCWSLEHLQVPTLIVMPSTDMARSFSESRLQPVIEETPELTAMKPSSDHKYKLLEMHLATATINLVGANSPSNISSRPIGLLVLDETDKYPERSRDEAAAIHLALERTKSYPVRKHFICSSPTYPNKAIWAFYLQGDRRSYRMPSPHCIEKTMTFSDLPEYELVKTKSGRIDVSASAKTAVVKCPHTGKPILDGDKYDMLKAGKWVPEDGSGVVRRRRSYQISTLYSLDFTWEEVVTKYLMEKDLPFGTQNFINGWQGLPYDVGMDETIEDMPVGDYGKRHPWPDTEVACRVLCVDVQRDHFWFVCRGLLQDGRIVLVDEGRIDTYEDIESLRERLGVEPDLVGIDCGFNSNEVKAQSAKYGWTCLNGVSERAYFFRQEQGRERIKRVSSPATQEPAYHAGGVMVPVIQWSSQAGQDLLDFYIKGGRWSTAGDVSPDYRVQMKSHKRESKVKKGREIYVWDRIGKTPDHLWDCETMAVVLLDALDLLGASRPRL